MGLDDPTRKMSKSSGSEASYIAIMDKPDVIRRKIKRAVTDSGTEVRGGPDKPAITNMLDIYSALSGEPVAAIEQRYEGKGYADFKADLGDVVVGGAGAHPGAHPRAGGRQVLHARRAQAGRRARRGHREPHAGQGARADRARPSPVALAPDPRTLRTPSLHIGVAARRVARYTSWPRPSVPCPEAR